MGIVSQTVLNRSDSRPITIPSEKASYVMPRHWEERLLRVYLKRDVDGDERRKYTEAVRVAFRNYLRRVGLDGQVHSPVLTDTVSCGKGSEYNLLTTNARMQLAALQSSFSSPPEQTVPSPTTADDASADGPVRASKRTRRILSSD